MKLTICVVLSFLEAPIGASYHERLPEDRTLKMSIFSMVMACVLRRIFLGPFHTFSGHFVRSQGMQVAGPEKDYSSNSPWQALVVRICACFSVACRS